MYFIDKDSLLFIIIINISIGTIIRCNKMKYIIYCNWNITYLFRKSTKNI